MNNNKSISSSQGNENIDRRPSTMTTVSRSSFATWLVVCTVVSLVMGRHSSDHVTEYWKEFKSYLMPAPTSTNLEMRLPPRLPLQKSWLEEVAGQSEADGECLNPQASSSSKTTAELLVHPLLLNIHPPPTAVVISSLPIFHDDALLPALIREIQRHKPIRMIYVAVDDLEQARAMRQCQEIVSRFDFQVQCLDLAEIDKQEEDENEEVSFTVDAVILPFADTVICADEFYDQEEQEQEQEDDDRETMEFWYDHLSDHGALITALGNTFPLEDIILTDNHMEETMEEPPKFQERYDRINALTKATFRRVIDFDIPASNYYYSEYQQGTSSTTASIPVNIGVAFKSNTGIAYWRWNEANYNRLIQERLDALDDRNDDLVVFDSATMLTLQHAPSHSSWWFCGSYNEAILETRECVPPGYDPYDPNVPLGDLYVSKSKAGENAGRGVFVSVDVKKGSNMALETTTDSIHFEWMTTQLQRNMMDEVKVFADSKAKIIHVYAEAYGYESNPWGMAQEAVMSHFLTFVNHGCNGTSNLGERGVDPSNHTEWSVDLDEDIPKDLRSEFVDRYNPNNDRNVVKYSTNCVAARDITRGEELYDNYINYGGDEFFPEMVQELRNQCSGELGLVEKYQADSKAMKTKFERGKDTDENEEDDDDEEEDRNEKM
jgi:hypothetical protein